jgi:hypothetical protein
VCSFTLPDIVDIVEISDSNNFETLKPPTQIKKKNKLTKRIFNRPFLSIKILLGFKLKLTILAL